MPRVILLFLFFWKYEIPPILFKFHCVKWTFFRKIRYLTKRRLLKVHNAEIIRWFLSLKVDILQDKSGAYMEGGYWKSSTILFQGLFKFLMIKLNFWWYHSTKALRVIGLLVTSFKLGIRYLWHKSHPYYYFHYDNGRWYHNVTDIDW